MFALRWQLILVMQKMRQPLVVCLNKHVTDYLLSSAERKNTEELCYLSKEAFLHLYYTSAWVVQQDYLFSHKDEELNTEIKTRKSPL